MDNWIKNVSLYPPAHIYAGKPQGKAERNAITVCEDLYRFNYKDSQNILGELRATYRDVVVLLRVEKCDPTHMVIKHEHKAEVFGSFLYWALKANREMEVCFKKHQDLWAWYNNFKIKNSVILDFVNSNLNAEERVLAKETCNILAEKYGK